jgi:glucokinase
MLSSRLAAYISGASVDLTFVRPGTNHPECYQHGTFTSADYSDFEGILERFLKGKSEEISVACLGVAGPVIKNEVTTTNLPWHLVGSEIEDRFSIGKVLLINDIVATAHGLAHLSSEKFYTINEGVRGDNGNIGLIAAGAGLGEAVVYRNGGQIFPHASEGGHADFAPGNQVETELWQYLYSELGYVEVEDVVSLTGLERIYNFLVDTQGGKRGDWFRQAGETHDGQAMAIVEMALSGRDATATRALDIFVNCYASEAANLALKGMTLGGVYIGGLLAPQIITALDHGRFMDRFVKKGKMERLLADIPVGVIIDDKTALLGAAGVAATM